MYDFSDWDEIDPDVEEALVEFEEGLLTFDELQSVVGPDMARVLRDKHAGADDSLCDPDSFFDSPEDF